MGAAGLRLFVLKKQKGWNIDRIMENNIIKIWLDIDHTLIYTAFEHPGEDCLVFEIDGDFLFTIVRPCAKRVIEFAREKFGTGNVHILTTSIREYAQKVNELAGWGFKNEDIFAREDLKKGASYFPSAYGGGVYEYKPQPFANKNNLIIDNLPPRENEEKIHFIGINKTYKTNYLQVKDYYGVNFPDDTFEEDVKNFLLDTPPAMV